MPASLVASRRMEWLTDQIARNVEEIDGVTSTAADEDRDLTDAEQQSCQRRRSAIEQYQTELETEAASAEQRARFDELRERVQPALRRPEPERRNLEPEQQTLYRSAGEYVCDYLLSRAENNADATARIDQYRRAAPNQLLADNPGIVPTPIVGDVINTISARRPAIEAATRRPMPASGKMFTRPIVTGHTDVAKQATEKTALAAQPMTIDSLNVTKETWGGYVNLSFQDRDWTDPAIMNLLIADLAAVYAQQTDIAFCTVFPAAVTQTETVDSDDAEGWLSAIYGAAGQVYAAGNALPNTLWVSVDVWGKIGAMVDGSGRPLFPYANPYNAMGSAAPTSFTANVAGLNMVVDGHLADGTAIVGDSIGVEFYEQIGGTLSVTEPKILGVEIAYYGYTATTVVLPDVFVKLTTPPVGP